ncbi:MAG: cupin domain-containing protein [Solirubrobacterales bacterium]|nr:cupin domain-containing protein [Solirubrobacterales bacterium]
MHDQDEEFYWVLEGEYRFTIDEEQFIAGPGGFVFIARGTPHGWVVGDQGGRTLISFAPRGGRARLPRDRGRQGRGRRHPRGLGTDSGPRPTRDG